MRNSLNSLEDYYQTQIAKYLRSIVIRPKKKKLVIAIFYFTYLIQPIYLCYNPTRG